MPSLATADDLRDYLEVSFGELDDERANVILDTVEGTILGYCNRTSFAVVDDDEVTLDGSGSDVLLLPSYPVTAVAIHDRLLDVDLVDDVDFEWTSRGILRRLHGRKWSPRARAYEIVFTHGYATLPPVLKGVSLRIAARAVVNPESLTSEDAEGYSARFAIDDSRLATVSTADRRDLDPLKVVSA